MPSVNELRNHVRELESEIAQMTEATENAREDRSTLEQQSRHEKEALERDLSDARREIASFCTKLEHYRDYDEVKRELEILKVGVSSYRRCTERMTIRPQFIEFASGDSVESDDVQLPNPHPGKVNVRLAGSLEALFAQKNKKLQEENARLRASIGRCDG